MSSKAKSKLFSKNKGLKNFFVSFLFILAFFLILFNKTDYLLINKIKSTGIDIVHPVANVISLPFKVTINTIEKINKAKIVYIYNGHIDNYFKSSKSELIWHFRYLYKRQ